MSGPELSILVIDENRVRAAIIEEGLREAGHSRITVISEMLGLVRRIEETAPDVIVIDLENPHRDGRSLQEGGQMTKALVPVRAGFLPLVDAALLIIARERDFARDEGIDLHLIRETSWANIRDRISVGHFDVAHMLAPLPIAAN